MSVKTGMSPTRAGRIARSLAVLSSVSATAVLVASPLLAQDGGGDPAGGGSRLPIWMAQPFLILSMLLIFYFLMIRPHQKRQKALQRMISGMKQGDRVLTSGGLYGTVVTVKDDLVILKIADNVKVDVAKSSVTSVDQAK